MMTMMTKLKQKLKIKKMMQTSLKLTEKKKKSGHST